MSQRKKHLLWLSFTKTFLFSWSKKTTTGAPKTIKVSITNVIALWKEDVVMKMQLKDEIKGEKKKTAYIGFLLQDI